MDFAFLIAKYAQGIKRSLISLDTKNKATKLKLGYQKSILQF